MLLMFVVLVGLVWPQHYASLYFIYMHSGVV